MVFLLPKLQGVGSLQPDPGQSQKLLRDGWGKGWLPAADPTQEAVGEQYRIELVHRVIQRDRIAKSFGYWNC
jgi:hypothetical protein